MGDIFPCLILYLIALFIYAKIRFPTTKFICDSCDRVTKCHYGDSCKCGHYFNRSDEATETRLMMREFRKLGLIKITKGNK